MQKDQLLELRNKIVQSTRELALKGEGAAADRLQVLMGLVRDGDADLETLTRAYELIQSIQGDDNKLTALLDLLYEVDAKITSADEAPQQAHAEVAPEHQQHHEQSHDQQ